MENNFFKKIKHLNIYTYLTIALIILGFVSSFQFGFKNTLPQIFIAAITAVILDSLFFYVKNRKLFYPKSAIITGIFIGEVLTTNLWWYIPLVASAAAILSKHLIKIKGKHIFNPANLGILFAALFFSTRHTWWASSLPFLVILFGLFIIYRFRRFHLILSFLISYYILNFIFISKLNFSDFYYLELLNSTLLFFAFFMLVEPRTSPVTSKGRIVYGISAAVLLIIFRILIPQHDLSLTLAVANIFTVIINRSMV